MKLDRLTILLAFSCLLVACATAQQMGRVQIGMTKEQVIAAMGKPASVSAQGEAEYLNYNLAQTTDGAFFGYTDPYYVRLISGRVESFGRKGDFDSTKTPTVRLETDQTVKQDIKVDASGDLYTELQKLKSLKDSGILTDEEFEAQKKKLLDRH